MTTVAAPVATHLLRVVWPILNDTLFDDEAFVEAWLDWPRFLRDYRVEPVDSPRIRVVDLDDVPLSVRERAAFRKATRAVVCEAPVVRRVLAAGRAA